MALTGNATNASDCNDRTIKNSFKVSTQNDGRVWTIHEECIGEVLHIRTRTETREIFTYVKMKTLEKKG